MIPKIIHQIWYQGEDKIPSTYPNYTKSWKEKNPDHKYIFWDKNKIVKLMKDHYPTLYKKFNSYPKMIQKIDMAKYVILYHYGGAYVDVDSECIKPISDLLKYKNMVLVQFNVNTFEKILSFGQIYGDVFQNGFIAGKKNHPFLKCCIEILLKEDTKKKIYETGLKYVFRTTGPGLLTKAFYKCPSKDVSIIPYNTIDPVSWCNYEYDYCSGESCKIKYPEAYSIHHFGSKHTTHNWTSDTEKKIGIFFCRFKRSIIVLFLILFIAILLVWYYKR